MKKAWRELIGGLESWAADKPKLISPCLALVEAYHGYAWAARGSGVASTVTDAAEKLMEDRIQKSFAWLRKAQDLDQKMIQPFMPWQFMRAWAQTWDRKLFEKFFRLGRANGA